MEESAREQGAKQQISWLLISTEIICISNAIRNSATTTTKTTATTTKTGTTTTHSLYKPRLVGFASLRIESGLCSPTKTETTMMMMPPKHDRLSHYGHYSQRGNASCTHSMPHDIRCEGGQGEEGRRDCRLGGISRRSSYSPLSRHSNGKLWLIRASGQSAGGSHHFCPPPPPFLCSLCGVLTVSGRWNLSKIMMKHVKTIWEVKILDTLVYGRLKWQSKLKQAKIISKFNIS